MLEARILRNTSLWAPRDAQRIHTPNPIPVFRSLITVYILDFGCRFRQRISWDFHLVAVSGLQHFA